MWAHGVCCAQAYAGMRKDTPDLVDLVAAGAAAEKENGGASEGQAGKGSKRKRIYEDHRPLADITAGIKRGIYHQARQRLHRHRHHA